MRVHTAALPLALFTLAWAGAANAITFAPGPPAPMLQGVVGTCAYFGVGDSNGSVSCNGNTATASYASGAGFISGTSAGSSTLGVIADVTYYFEVLSASSQTVALRFNAVGSTSVSGSYASPARATLDASVSNAVTSGSPIVNLHACSAVPVLTGGDCNYGATPPTLNASVLFMALTNNMYSVTLYGQAGAVAGGAASFEFDPDVVFDASTNQNGLSLVYSADAAVVPLPASAWLLLSGLAGLLFLSRRRSLKGAA